MKTRKDIGWFLLLACATLSASVAAAACPPLLDQKFNSIRGEPVNLCTFQGKVLLIVNTASYCGYTDQYKGLQAIHDQYRADGFAVIGFPANDFGKQEPGSNQEVADFCERTYKVAFPMMEKSTVVGTGANPFYAKLARQTGEAPRWNFHKYLIGRDGTVLKSFPSKVAPESAEIRAGIEQALAKK